MRAILPVCCITVLIGAAPTAADQPMPPPPQFNRAERAGWQSMIGPTPAQWSPTGTMIADSGFRPAVNGFGFFNYATADSVPNIANAYAFHQPAKVTNLAAPQLRTLFGDAVCRSSKSRCELTYAARHWRDATNAVMSAGHCWGLAVGAAVRFSRTDALGRPSTRDLTLTVPLQRRIARWQATQFEVDIDRYLTDPRSVVAALQRDLVAGQTPYVLLVESAQGLQHTLTPYALLDRGAGRYDIAVYDSNYPGRERAIHVNVVANTFAYEAFAKPTVQIASAQLGLVPVAALTERFACPFCPGASEVTIHLWGQRRHSDSVSASLRVTGESDRAMRGEYSWDGKERAPSSTWHVQPGKSFELRLRTAKPATFSALVSTGDLTWRLSGVRVDPHRAAAITFHPTRQTVTTSTAVDSLSVVDAHPGSEVQARVTSRPARPVAVKVADDRIVVDPRSESASKARVFARTTQVDRKGVFRDLTRRAFAVPLTHQVVIDYGRWSRRHANGVRIGTRSATAD